MKRTTKIDPDGQAALASAVIAKALEDYKFGVNHGYIEDHKVTTRVTQISKDKLRSAICAEDMQSLIDFFSKNGGVYMWIGIGALELDPEVLCQKVQRLSRKAVLPPNLFPSRDNEEPTVDATAQTYDVQCSEDAALLTSSLSHSHGTSFPTLDTHSEVACCTLSTETLCGS